MNSAIMAVAKLYLVVLLYKNEACEAVEDLLPAQNAVASLTDDAVCKDAECNLMAESEVDVGLDVLQKKMVNKKRHVTMKEKLEDVQTGLTSGTVTPACVVGTGSVFMPSPGSGKCYCGATLADPTGGDVMGYCTPDPIDEGLNNGACKRG